MIRTLLVASLFVGIFSGTASAGEDDPLLTGRSAAVSSCDQVAPVCGIMSKERMVGFASECEARAEGANRVVFGDCFDQN